MTSHTAGPWIARKIYGGNGEPLGWQIEAGKLLIAWPSVIDCGESEGAANAYLLAAAPDLLEQLRAAVAQLTADYNALKGDNYAGAERLDALAKMSDAIAKAQDGSGMGQTEGSSDQAGSA